jgi:hypothetical protein
MRRHTEAAKNLYDYVQILEITEAQRIELLHLVAVYAESIGNFYRGAEEYRPVEHATEAAEVFCPTAWVYFFSFNQEVSQFVDTAIQKG